MFSNTPLKVICHTISQEIVRCWLDIILAKTYFVDGCCYQRSQECQDFEKKVKLSSLTDITMIT